MHYAIALFVALASFHTTHGFLSLQPPPIYDAFHRQHHRGLSSSTGTVHQNSLPPEIRATSLASTPSSSKSITTTATTETSASIITRRDSLSSLLIGIASLSLSPLASSAEDGDDLTTQLFNPDGSLKQADISTEAATYRPIAIPVPTDSGTTFNFIDNDGATTLPSSSLSTTTIQYSLPRKWNSGFLDTSQGVNARALQRITIYRPTGTYTPSTLATASTVGISKVLQLPRVAKADLISGRKREENDLVYYDFDLAVAPESCGSSEENLGLGFCPYDNVVLVSAVVADGGGDDKKEGDCFVFVLECDKEQWRRGNSDLKRVRTSFRVG